MSRDDASRATSVALAAAEGVLPSAALEAIAKAMADLELMCVREVATAYQAGVAAGLAKAGKASGGGRS